MGSQLVLNQGAQQSFVFNDYRASAFVGGLGSGKTYALNARGLVLAQQPKVGFWGPRGCLAAINYPVLKDVVLPQFFEMIDGTGLLLDYSKQEKKALLIPINEHGVPDRRLGERPVSFSTTRRNRPCIFSAVSCDTTRSPPDL